jgi:hypothetical protein
MLRQLLLATIVSLCNIALHAVAMGAVIGATRRVSAWQHRRPQVWLVAVMAIAVGVLMLVHVAEVMAWSMAYVLAGVVPPEADALYFAFVNYTTLGYGDILPVVPWRLLGPLTAMNGVLLFGWSTAVIFEVMRNAIRMLDARRAVDDA